MNIVYTVLNGRIAGGQMICLRILQAARKRGDRVSLVSPSRGELTELLERDGVQVFIIPLDRTFHLHRAWQLSRVIRKQRADLVHCHAFIPGAILARIAGALAGVPVICHLHAFPTFSRNHLVRVMQLTLERVTARFARFIAVSGAVRDAYIAHGIPADRVTVIANGVAPGDPVPSEAFVVPGFSRARPESSATTVLVGYAGRLSAQKGLDDLVDAIATLKTRGIDAQLLIAGEEHDGNGTYPSALRQRVADRGLNGQVRFLGFVPDIDRFMQSLDIFVLPSHLEAHPVSILEAMAAGRPVVATTVGGVPEIVVSGSTGTLVPPRNAERLADAIADLAADPALREKYGRSGRERVAREFSEQRMLSAVWDAYAGGAGVVSSEF